MDVVGDLINLAIAVFTAAAAGAAWVSTRASLKAIGQANRQGEESRAFGGSGRENGSKNLDSE